MKIARSYPHLNVACMLADVGVKFYFLCHVCNENREECCLINWGIKSAVRLVILQRSMKLTRHRHFGFLNLGPC